MTLEELKAELEAIKEYLKEHGLLEDYQIYMVTMIGHLSQSELMRKKKTYKINVPARPPKSDKGKGKANM